jgi:membrane-bound lytic murein transglycosylase F
MQRSVICLLLLLFLISGCSNPPPNLLEQIKARGALRIASYNGPTTIYQGPQGQTGFEYDLVSLFANRLGVQASFQMVDNSAQAISHLQTGKADVAAGLLVTPERERQVRFSPSYQQIEYRVIQRTPPGQRSAQTISDLLDSRLAFTTNSALEARLQSLQQAHPQLRWTHYGDCDSEELINRLDQGKLDFVIAPSNHFALVRRYYPRLQAGMSLLTDRHLAWGLAGGPDESLQREAIEFFADINKNGKLTQLIERYYGHTELLNSVDLLVFRRHYRERLPQYLPAIKYAAFISNFDWRMLAAMAYQESHWDPQAVSPTGVRGLMMLTRGTASDIGVTDRTDPQQSILGGARYLRQIKEKLPERIGEPDRTWFALASYNVGFGHLQDARFLALLEKRNPDKWSVIKRYLPRLTEKKWHSQTAYGYARGKEPVHYVDNIRSYYDVLLQLDKQQAKSPPTRP